MEIEFAVAAVCKGGGGGEVADRCTTVGFAVAEHLVFGLVHASAVQVLDQCRRRKAILGEAQRGSTGAVGADESEAANMRAQRRSDVCHAVYLDDVEAGEEVVAFGLGGAFPVAALDVQKQRGLVTGAHKQRAATDGERQPVPKGRHHDERPVLIVESGLALRRARMNDQAIEAVLRTDRRSAGTEGLEVQGI